MNLCVSLNITCYCGLLDSTGIFLLAYLFTNFEYDLKIIFVYRLYDKCNVENNFGWIF